MPLASRALHCLVATMVACCDDASKVVARAYERLTRGPQQPSAPTLLLFAPFPVSLVIE